jgi:hypothetical protein
MSTFTEHKLPPYKYESLTSPDKLRLLRLIPASFKQVDIDCELVEVDFGDVSLDEEAHVSYEALSWCWGGDIPNAELRMHKGHNVFGFNVTPNLKAALRALRKHDGVRMLWIDAICIEQRNTEERNEQVPRMDKIYGKAKSVCIWLGEEADESNLAIKFIKDQVLSLWEFDKLIENRAMARHWAALINLMKRPWFSRRWVVQEIALSPRGGTLYCGREQVSWQDFADAVSLFVEVESATHRLSDVMRRDQLFDNIPDFFGDVSSLGAALLVDATSNLFRNSQAGKREPLSTLEYLVSRLSVFESTQPRDTIYALLAISQDTTPKSAEQDGPPTIAAHAVKNMSSRAANKIKALGHNFNTQPYNVDYKLPVLDVYKEFVDFAIQKSDKSRALDIMCRPWAPVVKKSHDDPYFLSNPAGLTKQALEDDEEIPLPSWIPSLSSAAFEMEEHPRLGLRMERQTADPLVGLPGPGQRRNYSAAGTTSVENKGKMRFKKWDSLKKPGAYYPDYSLFVKGFILDEVATVEQIASNGNIPFQWLRPGGWTDTRSNPPEAFWRTLVADRGHGGRNPPTYFPRACRESMKFKAKTKSKAHGNLDSKKLINEGRCTIVAEFLRRVQAVIWNRLLMTTAGAPSQNIEPKFPRLGLVRDDVRPGFKICILYGCSVPVVLQEIIKTKDEAQKELQALYEDFLERRKRAIVWISDIWKLKLARRAASDVLHDSEAADSIREIKSKPRTLLKSNTWPSRMILITGQDASPLVDEPWSVNGDGVPHANNRSRANERAVDNELDRVGRPSESQLLTENDASSQLSSKEDTGSVSELMGISRQLKDPPVLGVHIRENGGADTPSSAAQKLEETTNADDDDCVSEEANKEAEYRLAELKERGKREDEEADARWLERNRPEKHYKMFGECYVHGMMDGEAITLAQNPEEYPPRIFELR